MRHYCTYFDSRYLPRALALYRSLERHSGPFTLWTLCMDDGAYDTLSRLRLPAIRPVRLQELEAFDPDLAATKKKRSLIEYYFTCSPCWPLYVLDRLGDGEMVTYLDADLYFYSSPEPIFRELGESSVLIVGHRFPPHLKHLELYGVFNVGYLSFRRDAHGLACLGWWRERCLEWCRDRPEEGRFADQKYLDAWPGKFKGVVVSEHPGSGLAPWNVCSHEVALRGETPWVDEKAPVIFYHFHKLKVLGSWLFDLALDYEPFAPASVRALIYRPYVEELRRCIRWVEGIDPAYRQSTETIREAARRRYTMMQTLRALKQGKLMLSVAPVKRVTK